MLSFSFFPPFVPGIHPLLLRIGTLLFSHPPRPLTTHRDHLPTPQDYAALLVVLVRLGYVAIFGGMFGWSFGWTMAHWVLNSNWLVRADTRAPLLMLRTSQSPPGLLLLLRTTQSPPGLLLLLRITQSPPGLLLALPLAPACPAALLFSSAKW